MSFRSRLSLLAVLAATVVFLNTVPVLAEPGSGKDFIPDCTGKDPYKKGFCTGYIAGVDHLLSTLVEKKKIGKMYCAGEDVTLGKLREIWINWLKAHPDKQDSPAVISLMMALREAYSCAKPE